MKMMRIWIGSLRLVMFAKKNREILMLRKELAEMDKKYQGLLNTSMKQADTSNGMLFKAIMAGAFDKPEVKAND